MRGSRGGRAGGGRHRRRGEGTRRYEDAIRVLGDVWSHRGSVKDLALREHVGNKKFTYAIVVETLKCISLSLFPFCFRFVLFPSLMLNRLNREYSLVSVFNVLYVFFACCHQ